MTIEVDYGDLPISKPEQDKFGIDGFVRSLARSVTNMRSPSGVVIALNGQWGSGKSSAMNLLKHHLLDATTAGEIELVDFNPWWFRGEEALVLAFFRELYSATKPSLSEKAGKLLPKLGARLLNAGGAVAPIADAVGAPGTGAIASGVMGWLSSMIEDGESVEKLHRQLSEALAGQSKRFVVLIDDIDRLAPDEALAMFRMVKSVGRLPNVIYVLSFDRELAERVVAERFPSEGPHYLEKIVQAAFELPAPLEEDVQRILIEHIDALVGGIEKHRQLNVMNMFHAAVAPEIRTPRDAARYINALTITWPAVDGEVDLGDFIAIEAFRLFQPSIYRAVRDNRALVCEATRDHFERDKGAERLDAVLLSKISEKQRYRDALVRLFPGLDSIWGNTIHHGSGSEKDRRIASTRHFQTYFRMSIDTDTVSRKDLGRILANPADSAAISFILMDALSQQRRDGTTRTAVWLEALDAHAEEIPIDAAEPFLRGVFAVADDINVDSDRARGFSFGDNHLRIHWLLRSLMRGRTTLRERSAILLSAAHAAQLGWLGNLTGSAFDDYHPGEGKSREPDDKCLLTEADTETARALFLDRIRAAALDGSLMDVPQLLRTLYLWLQFLDDDAEIREWIALRIEEDTSLVRLASAFTTQSWSQSSNDLVAIRSDRAFVADLDKFMDPDRFRSNLTGLLARLEVGSDDYRTVDRFLKAWMYRDEHGDRWAGQGDGL
ncbi:KAP family P-loop NTPase fold protein [Ancylobacter polymorphus]|uniref:KAP-like P-loop ATPase n=1 Tax=Ancylobacter polymorphus TaxID=223390 RepID=A0ABU0B697_9HYPH|nr:P-loop NTPase fold protein [Ancylobacter polymorphus]MDQ0301338.1 putative KAP-like P-loop ATPase [Ancylobacter polymorphus]